MRNGRIGERSSGNRLTKLSPLMALLAVSSALAQQEEALENVVVTGTRVANRTALDTAVPVDVITSESLENIGVSEVNQALSVALPSFNFPRPGLSDGTDTIRPATLRGLSPDQTLVLVNGKRRHSASLVNVNGTVGRGAAAVDLNTIPNAILKSIEVLRDGASAQYGSDAIAGVINMRLRDANDGGDATVTYGVRDSSYETNTAAPPAGAGWSAPARLQRDVSDGETLTVSAWKGLPLGTDGFVTLAAEYKDQERTERGGWDHRQQYPLIAPGTFDPRELTFQRFSSWYGEPELDEKTLFANTGYDFASGAKLYGWASWQQRDARSAGFFRRALDARNTLEIYPDGFLPIIAPEVTDYSAAGGVTWKLGEWDMDSSLVYGKNKMEFTIENTLNRSLGPASKTRFDAGGFEYDQVVMNFSGVRSIEVSAFSSPLNVAAGVEARREGYSIFAGEPDSYRNGGVLLPSGVATQPGAQVFPGFNPSHVVDEHRTAVGAYLDLEANITEKFLASAAVRAEHYSDFGDNVSGKLSMRFNFTDSFALRGSVQNGFRAPSLQQQFFAATSTNFNSVGVPFDVITFPVTDPVAVALGAQPLDAEESVNFSVGAVLQLGDLSITIDAYRIDIDDRIVLSENLTQDNVRTYLASQGFVGVDGVRFFLNGVDTETKGIDVVMNYPFTAGANRFDLTLTGNFNSTDVTRVPITPQLAALNPAPVLFDRLNVKAFEEGNPENKFTAGVNWALDRFGATVRAIRYGESLTPANSAALDFVNEAATLVDVEARFDVTESVRLALGADNVFDEYPEPLPTALNTTGNAPFSNYSPFGRSGRFVYGRVGVSF
jgi:iron complex outermembrane recepter protein